MGSVGLALVVTLAGVIRNWAKRGRWHLRSSHWLPSMASVQFNSVVSWQFPFSRRSNSDKWASKKIRTSKTKFNNWTGFYKGVGKSYTQEFSINEERKNCLAGCEEANAVFCYPCLVFHPEGGTADSTAWVSTGGTDMHNLSWETKEAWAVQDPHGWLLEICGYWEGDIATRLQQLQDNWTTLVLPLKCCKVCESSWSWIWRNTKMLYFQRILYFICVWK